MGGRDGQGGAENINGQRGGAGAGFLSDGVDNTYVKGAGSCFWGDGSDTRGFPGLGYANGLVGGDSCEFIRPDAKAGGFGGGGGACRGGGGGDGYSGGASGSYNYDLLLTGNWASGGAGGGSFISDTLGSNPRFDDSYASEGHGHVLVTKL